MNFDKIEYLGYTTTMEELTEIINLTTDDDYHVITTETKGTRVWFFMDVDEIACYHAIATDLGDGEVHFMIDKAFQNYIWENNEDEDLMGR